ncbi:Signal transduction histidine kinase [Actinacidiphila alni]|uniref:Signal transduction histidine kinase n=1 Tax=Actinacidiphila alni TaxID=380248 RepID=A0A1I2ISB1_9ACTN|nr:histidine kinase [Actinacidiphila alni]SFF44620.1 Signal transduction histidine kinase [Actinacidiphila alni]
MLLTVSWLLRWGAYVLAGCETFTRISLGPAARTVTIVAYVLSGALMALWSAAELRAARPGAAPWRNPLLMPVLLGTIAVASGAAATLPDAGTMIAMTVIAVLSAASDHPLPTAWSVTGAGVLAIETAQLITGASTGIALGYPVTLVVGMLVGRNRRSDRVRAEQAAVLLARSEELRAQADELREQQRQVAVLDERTRIAREIHDVLAHSLGALGIQIQAARALLTDDGDVERAVGVLGVAQRIASDGLTETRRAVHALRTDTPPLDEELARMTAAHRQRHGTQARLTVRGTPVPLPADQTLALVRTAQESLTNAAKHAKDRPVTLTLRYGDDDVTLTIRNPLPPADEDAAPGFSTVDGGYGLTGMRERLLLLGGALTAGPAGDGEWRVAARVPR